MKKLYLKRWEKYQYGNGKSIKECEEHLSRYGTEYFPITIQEQIRILKECGFRGIEIFLVLLYAGMSKGKTHDDGYRGVHVYY